MKLHKLLIIIFLFSAFSTFGQKPLKQFNSKVDELYKANVIDGKINYPNIQKNPKTINYLINFLDTFHCRPLEISDRKAYLINAYNLFVIKSISKAYPITSPKEIKGFFDNKQCKIEGELMSLNDLEHKYIREMFNDPRVHFALVCGANGCPSLAGESFKGDQIESQLETQTKKTLNSNFISSDSDKVKFSEIFKWYGDDFEGESNIINYINQYRDEKIPENTPLEYYEYDWNTNSSEPK